jgi:hypothetical protein
MQRISLTIEQRAGVPITGLLRFRRCLSVPGKMARFSEHQIGVTRENCAEPMVF